jgi:DNA-binding PucR family transcriptional regulator
LSRGDKPAYDRLLMAVTQQAVVVEELAAELLTRTPALAHAMADHLSTAIPELAALDGDGEVLVELRASTESNISQALRLLKLRAGVDQAVLPPEAREFLRGNVRRGISLPTLLRSYRLGHAWLWDQWMQALQERIHDPDELIAAQEVTSAFMFAYVDRVCDVLAEEYGSEREQLMRGAAQLRAEAVRAILAGEPVDDETLSRRLGYEIRRNHVALRVFSAGKEARGLDRAVLEAAATLGPGEPLVVPSGAASFDVWYGSFDAPDTKALQRYAPPDGLRVAFGGPAHGVAGFRRCHDEAVQAARVASLARATGAPVTAYADVELVSLLARDLPRARTFVANRLGPLGAPGEPTERLRQTVRAFLAAGGSAKRAAEQLYVHQNTVAYRVKRAEELLGRSVTEDPVELICALTLAATLGAAVLGEDGSA